VSEQAKAMGSRQNNPEREDWSGRGGTHEKFLELCALSTSGELTGEERTSLEAHLSGCPDCRQALREFEAAAEIGVPLLHEHLAGSLSAAENSLLSQELQRTSANEAARTQEVKEDAQAMGRAGLLALPHGNGRRSMQVNWNYVWVPFAAAVLLTAALGIYSYQFGKQKGREIVAAAPRTPDTKLEALEQQISDSGHEREVLKAQLAQRDGMISQLRGEIEKQSQVLAEARDAQASLQHSLQNHETEMQEVAQEQNRLIERLGVAQASLQKTQAELDSLRQQRSQDQSRAESLEAQIRDLHGQLRDQEQELGKQQELLAHDRDIRELMGARDLYIAEVYDVARDGQTQKPYGRIFYTKGKSLIFYAYDLDQQAGLKSRSTFQAWGSRGPDRQQATSLGVFYEDNLAKKRWVLKFDDPKRLEQIDAVFVTIEPNGGSHKPSGKPLLFAYLKVNPNHP
jgi:hypothetical protein